MKRKQNHSVGANDLVSLADSALASPRPRFMLWVRRSLIAIWLLILVTWLPPYLKQSIPKLASMNRGPERNEMIREMIFDVVGTTIIFPAFLMAILGFGVFPRPAFSVWATGGPWFSSWLNPDPEKMLEKAANHKTSKGKKVTRKSKNNAQPGAPPDADSGRR